jgi:hypothetical protein
MTDSKNRESWKINFPDSFSSLQRLVLVGVLSLFASIEIPSTASAQRYDGFLTSLEYGKCYTFVDLKGQTYTAYFISITRENQFRIRIQGGKIILIRIKSVSETGKCF